MNIKHLAGITVIGLSLSFGAMAGSQDKADRIAEKLDLDADRAAQVEQIMSDYYEGRKALKEQKRSQLEELLTDEEMDKLKAVHERRREQMHKDC